MLDNTSLNNQTKKISSLCSSNIEATAALNSGVLKLFLPFRMLQRVSWLNWAIRSQIIWLALLLFILLLLYIFKNSYIKKCLLLKFKCVKDLFNHFIKKFLKQPREGKIVVKDFDLIIRKSDQFSIEILCSQCLISNLNNPLTG